MIELPKYTKHSFKLKEPFHAMEIAKATGNPCVNQFGDYAEIIVHEDDPQQTREQLAAKLKANGMID